MRTIHEKFENVELGFVVDENHIYFTDCGFFKQKKTQEQINFSHLSEVQISGKNHLEHHFCKHYCSSENYSLLFVEKSTSRIKDGRRIKIVQRNDDVEVCTYFEFIKGIEGYKTYKEITCLRDKIDLNYVAAFTFMGLGGKEWERDVNVYVPHNYWKAECSWRKYKTSELGLYHCSDFSAKRISFSSTGTWTSVEYLPMGMLENTKAGRFMLWQIEGVAAWAYEISTIGDDLYLSVSGPTLQESFWQKNLYRGEKYVTPSVVLCFGNDLDAVFGNLTMYRRQVRGYKAEYFGAPAIFNDYMHCLDTDPTTEKELPFIDIAADIGCKYYMIDAGWYTDDFWWDYTGEWVASKRRFPQGLNYVMQYIRDKGMTPGLWVEIEVMSIGLDFAKNLPDAWFLTLGGKRVQDNSRYILDFSNGEVRDFADGVMHRLIVEYGAGFVKMDHNVNGGVGTDKNGNVGAGLEAHIRGYYDWVQNMIKRYPKVLFENCASGGCRMDAELLKHFQLQSTSDQTDYRKYAPISANIITAVTPEQAGVWTYPLPRCDEEETAFNMVNAILRRIYQAGRLDKVNKKCLQLVKEAVRINGALHALIQNGRAIYPIGLAKFDDAYVCSGLQYKDEKYICIWNLDNMESFDIPLEKYNVQEVELVYPKSLKTEYMYLSEKEILRITPHQKYFARLFKLV